MIFRPHLTGRLEEFPCRFHLDFGIACSLGSHPLVDHRLKIEFPTINHVDGTTYVSVGGGGI